METAEAVATGRRGEPRSPAHEECREPSPRCLYLSARREEVLPTSRPSSAARDVTVSTRHPGDQMPEIGFADVGQAATCTNWTSAGPAGTDEQGPRPAPSAVTDSNTDSSRRRGGCCPSSGIFVVCPTAWPLRRGGRAGGGDIGVVRVSPLARGHHPRQSVQLRKAGQPPRRLIGVAVNDRLTSPLPTCCRASTTLSASTLHRFGSVHMVPAQAGRKATAANTRNPWSVNESMGGG